jgi:hypothetical protein
VTPNILEGMRQGSEKSLAYILRVEEKSDLLLGTTNKMQNFTIFFIIVNALHVSSGFSAHHQELKNCTQHLVRARLAAATASGGSKQAWYDAVCTVFELLMMGEETARNM